MQSHHVQSNELFTYFAPHINAPAYNVEAPYYTDDSMEVEFILEENPVPVAPHQIVAQNAAMDWNFIDQDEALDLNQNTDREIMMCIG